MINFDELPSTNPYSLIAADIYKAKIIAAEMRKPNNKNDDGTDKPPYLNLTYALTNHAGKACGKMYDSMYESNKSVCQYKLARFVQACGIPLRGTMELSDIGKLVLNKEIVVDVMHDDKSARPRLQVDPFTHEAYYPIGQFDEIYNIVHAENADTSTEAVTNADFMNIPENSPEEVEY